MNLEKIKERLIKKFPNAKVDAFDLRDSGDHFSIVVISDEFDSVSLVNRHRMIYSIFKDEITKEIHAMQIQTYTYKEWRDKK